MISKSQKLVKFFTSNSKFELMNFSLQIQNLNWWNRNQCYGNILVRFVIRFLISGKAAV